MKIICEESEREGLESFLGKPIAVWCLNYIYSGILVGINGSCIKLRDAYIVYDTGPFGESGWEDAQAMPGDAHYVQISAIESFGGVK